MMTSGKWDRLRSHGPLPWLCGVLLLVAAVVSFFFTQRMAIAAVTKYVAQYELYPSDRAIYVLGGGEQRKRCDSVCSDRGTSVSICEQCLADATRSYWMVETRITELRWVAWAAHGLVVMLTTFASMVLVSAYSRRSVPGISAPLLMLAIPVGVLGGASIVDGWWAALLLVGPVVAGAGMHTSFVLGMRHLRRRRERVVRELS